MRTEILSHLGTTLSKPATNSTHVTKTRITKIIIIIIIVMMMMMMITFIERGDGFFGGFHFTHLAFISSAHFDLSHKTQQFQGLPGSNNKN